MAELQTRPFVSTEAEVEPDDETLRLLDARIADQTPLVPADKARQQVQQWLSNSSTSKPR